MGYDNPQQEDEALIPIGRRDFMKMGAAGVAGFAGLSSAGAVRASDGDDVSPHIQFPDDAGIVDVTEDPWNAAGDGETDDTEAIQGALSANPSGNKIVYVPEGTYKISDTLEWPSGGGGGTQKRTILMGESRTDTRIILEDDAPGYQDPDDRKGMIWTGLAPAQRFRNAVRNITIDAGSGNPGAAGLQFIANNQGAVENVDIVAEDEGAVGLDLAYTSEFGPMLVRDVFVRGFDVGIMSDAPTASITFENITVEKQNDYGIYNTGSQMLFIRSLLSRNRVPAVYNEASGDSHVALVDARLVGRAGAEDHAAIVNEQSLYARNVLTSKYAKAIQNDVDGGAADVDDRYVKEYTQDGTVHELFTDSTDQSLAMEVKDVPSLSWDDPSEWASPYDHGGNPEDDSDDAPAIQAAIDSGASTVYLPNDDANWTIDSEVVIRGNVKRFIGTEAGIDGTGSVRLADGAPDTVVTGRMDPDYGSDVTFVHDSDRTWVIEHMLGGGYEDTPNAGTLFIDDIVMDGSRSAGANPFAFEHAEVYARQLNQETNTTKTDAEAKVVNDGTKVWILGMKTEKAGPIVKTKNGGTTEIIGAFPFANFDDSEYEGDIPGPIFVDEDSQTSYAGVATRGPTWQYFVEETRNGTTRRLSLEDFGTGNLYSGHTQKPVKAPRIGDDNVGVDNERDWTGGFPVRSPNGSTANLSVFHGSPDAGPVDVYLDDQQDMDPTDEDARTFAQLGYREAAIEFSRPEVSSYIKPDAGDRQLAVSNGGGTVFDETVSLAQDTNYTYAIAGQEDDGSLELLEFVDDVQPPSDDGTARLVVHHISPSSGPVDLTIDGTEVLDGIQYKEKQTIDVGAGTLDLTLTDDTEDSGPSFVTSEVEGGTAYRAYIIGDLERKSITMEIDRGVSTAPAPGLRAYYQMDTDDPASIPDATGNNLPASISGGTAGVPGAVGDAIYTEKGEGLGTPRVDVTGDEFTAAFWWYYFDGPGGYGGFFGSGGWNVNLFPKDSDTGLNSGYLIADGYVFGTTAFEHGKWYYTVITQKDQEFNWYLYDRDGLVEQITDTAGGYSPTSSSEFYAHGNMQGTIDDVYLYNIELSESEVQALYNEVDTSALPEPIEPPSDLSASFVSDGIELTWTGTDGATGYRVKRRPADSDTFTTLADVGASTTSYTDTNPPTDVARAEYEVVALSDGVESPPARVTTLTQPVSDFGDITDYETFSSTEVNFGSVNDGDSYLIEANGDDVYGNAGYGIFEDEYGAVFTPDGLADGEQVTVKVEFQEDTHEYAKAGVMIRNDITAAEPDPDNPDQGSLGYAVCYITPGNGAGWLHDGDGDGYAGPNGNDSEWGPEPIYLRLERDGGLVIPYASPDGETWDAIGRAYFPDLLDDVQDVGFFATSHTSDELCTVQFDEFTVEPAN